MCETHTATGELDALLGSARETEKVLRQRRREREYLGMLLGGEEAEVGLCVTGTQIFNLLNFSP